MTMVFGVTCDPRALFSTSWWRAAVGSLLLAPCVACSSGGSGGNSSDATAETGGEIDASGEGGAVLMDCGVLAWSGDACAACTATRCCSIESVCAAIPSCAPLSECVLACGADAGCATACDLTYQQAASNYNAILNCQSNACPAECAP